MPSFGLQENLVSGFVWKLNHLILDRGAISRPGPLDSSGVESGLTQIPPNDFVSLVCRVRNPARHLFHGEHPGIQCEYVVAVDTLFRRQKTKSDRRIVSKLFFALL